MSNNFRDLIPLQDHPRIAGITERDAYSHAAHTVATRPRVQGLLAERRVRLEQPFRGITTNGDVVPDLYAPADEAAPTGAMVEAARAVLIRQGLVTPALCQGAWGAGTGTAIRGGGP